MHCVRRVPEAELDRCLRLRYGIAVRRSQFVALAGSRGSITLPADVRRRYHLDEPGAQVEVIAGFRRVVIDQFMPAAVRHTIQPGSAWPKGLREPAIRWRRVVRGC